MPKFYRWGKHLSKLLIVAMLSVYMQGVAPGVGPAPRTAEASSGISNVSRLGFEEFMNYFHVEVGGDWKLGVNTFTGNMVVQTSLFQIAARGPALSESITYNSLSTVNNGFGPGWALANDWHLSVNSTSGNVTIRDEDGTNHLFTANSDGTYKSPAGLFLTLIKNSSSVYTMINRDDLAYRFESGYLVSVTDIYGNRLLITRDSSKRITKVTDASGRWLTYTWDTNAGRITSIADPAGRTYSFAYDANSRLASVTDPRSKVTSFTYDSNGRMISFKNAKSQTTSIAYTSGGRAEKILDARSTSTTEYPYTFTYDLSILVHKSR